jgi:hypothetical protein
LPKGTPDIHIPHPAAENIFILGIRRQGKTNYLAYLLSRLSMPYTLWDEVGAVSRIFRPLYPQTQKIVYPPIFPKLPYISKEEANRRRELKLEAFDSVCHTIMNKGNQMFIVDEVHTFCDKRNISYEFNELITKGGNINVGFIGTSQSVSQVSNIILGNTLHFFIFRTTLPNDIEWLGKVIPKRIVEQSQYVEPYGFIYHKVGMRDPVYGAAIKKMTLF